jgi:hypothetical protein
MKEQIVRFRSVTAANNIDVARTARHNQSRVGALALNQGVDGDRGSVDQFVDLAGIEAAFAQAVDDAKSKIGRRA